MLRKLSFTCALSLLVSITFHLDAWAQPIPRWDPLSSSCSGVPPISEVAGSWQIAAPRVAEPLGSDVELGLRSKFGADAPLDVYVVVISPVGEFGQGEPRQIVADEWASINYPSDFIGGSTLVVGPYTVVWQSDDGYIACDGFVIRP